MHVEENELRMNWPYISFVLFASALGLGVTVWVVTTRGFSDLSPSWNLMAVAITNLACLMAFAGLIWKIYRDSETLVSADGVRRPSFVGQTFLRWSEVREVRFVRFGIHLIGAAGRVVISPYAYRDPQRLIKRIRTLLRQAGHSV